MRLPVSLPLLPLVALAACSSAPVVPAPHATTAASSTLASASAPSPAPAAPAAVYPVTPVREVRDTYFGAEIVDPYRWMETDSPEYAAWMKSQAEHTNAMLAKLDVRAALRKRLAELNNAGTNVYNVQRWGGLIFSLNAEPGKDIARLLVRTDVDKDPRVLLDPATQVKGTESLAIDYYRPSPDGKYVAYGISPSGSELSVLHVLETATGKELPETIDRARYASISWLDGKSFFYKRDRALPPDAPATERFTKARVYLHVLGQDPEKDVAVFGYGLSPAIEIPEEAFPMVEGHSASPYVFAALEHGVQPNISLYYAPKKSLAGAKTPWKKLVDPKDEITGYDVHEDNLYLVSHHGAPRGKLLLTSLKAPDISKATEIIPQGKAVLSWTGAARDALYVRTLDGGMGRLYKVGYTGTKVATIDLGADSSVRSFFTNEDTPGALVRLDSWTRAPSMVAVYATKKKQVEETKIIPPSSVVFEGITSTKVEAKSADGTLVPLSIIHKKDLQRDGKNPTYMQGYGAYGRVFDPAFDPMSLGWLERGGIVAICHVRGGGEYGEEWHLGGKLATKPNTILDFIACGEHLVKEQWTSPAHLAGQGTSAGGIMIGGAIVRRPDLFGAAIIRVGMVNALRFEQIPIGPFNTGEFGSVATKEGFEMLRAIDAYHAVEKGRKYPAVMLTTGASDTRVSPWQMAKMAARLQASTASDKPVLLRVDYGSGHGIGVTKSQREEELADVFAFLLSQIGRDKSQ